MFYRYLFNPTYKCNLNCSYCYLGYQNVRNNINESDWNPEKTLRQLIKMINQYDINDTSIIFHGGECTTLGYEKLELLFSIAKECKKIGGISLQTNTILFDDKFVSICKKYNVDIGSSYDGPKSNRKNILGEDVSKIIRKKLEFIKNSGLRVNILVQLLPLNTIEELANDLADLGIQLEVRIPNTYKEYYFELKDLGYNTMVDYLIDWWNKGLPILQKAGIRDRTISQMIGCVFPQSNLRTVCKNSPCRCLPLVISVDGDGTVTPCNPLGNIKLGNIFNNSFEEIVLSNKNLRMTSRYQTLFKTECSGCEVWNYCFGSCPAESVGGDFTEEESIISVEKKIDKDFCDYIRALYYTVQLIHRNNPELFSFYLDNENQKVKKLY